MQSILIVDDNTQILSILSEYAKKEGFSVTTAIDGEDAIIKFENKPFSIILLDVMLPKKDGFEVCKHIRESSNIPIIMVTAKGEDYDRIMGLDIGADDYIVKPFSPGEVMARIRAILRRISPSIQKNSNIFTFDNLKLNLNEFTAEINKEIVSLTKKEFELFWTLATNMNKVFSRDNLLDNLWGYDYLGDIRTVDSHIKRLRKKIDNYPHRSWDIKTMWGVGYKFEVENDQK